MHSPISPLPRPDNLTLRKSQLPLLLYLALAVAVRAIGFGNPVIHVDEQFYLLVGERMLDGDWPYVAVFDRKPFLLFAINALFAAFGPHALLASQIGATLAVVITALLLHRLGGRVLSGNLALLPGALYIAMLPGFEGIGAQAPIFYTPLVCAAALFTVRAIETGRPALPGVLAMLASGLALQIKYSAVFECGFFGVALLWRAHRSGWPTARIAAAALLWIFCALLPSIVVAAAYAGTGHWDEFWAANVAANLAMASPLSEALPRLAVNLAVAAGVLVCAAAGWRAFGWRMGAAAVFLRWWLMAALLGYLLYGTWYTHYMLPVLAPLALLASAGLVAESPLPRRAVAALVMLSLVACGIRAAYLLREHGDADQAEAIARAIDTHLGPDRDLFIYSGDPGFYRLTQASLPRPYVFPDHYSRNSARRFMSLTPPEALREAFAKAPDVVMRVDKLYPDRDRASDKWLAAELAGHYQAYARLPIGSKHVLLYRRLR